MDEGLYYRNKGAILTSLRWSPLLPFVNDLILVSITRPILSVLSAETEGQHPSKLAGRCLGLFKYASVHLK